jgi:hypothetical protein
MPGCCCAKLDCPDARSCPRVGNAEVVIASGLLLIRNRELAYEKGAILVEQGQLVLDVETCAFCPDGWGRKRVSIGRHGRTFFVC